VPLFGPPNVKKLKAKGDVVRLGSALRYEDQGIRESAAVALADLGTPQALEPLVKALAFDLEERPAGPARNIPSGRWRENGPADAALAGLRQVEDPGSIEWLWNVLWTEIYDRGELVEVLLSLPGPPDFEALAKLLGAPDRRTRELATNALVEMDDPQARDALLAGLEPLLLDSREGLREHATNLLRRLDDPRVTEVVVKGLTSGYPLVQQFALETLERFGQAGRQALISALGDPYKALRVEAARVLGVLGDESAVEPLAAALRGPGDEALKAQAATALGRLKDRRATGSLVDALASGLPEVRRSAAWALGELGDAAAAEALVAALDDHRGVVRSEAERSLERLGADKALEPLRRARAEEAERLRELKRRREEVRERPVPEREPEVETAPEQVRLDDVRISAQIDVTAAGFLTGDEAMRYIGDSITKYDHISVFVITARGSTTLEHAHGYLREAQPTLGVENANIRLLELRDQAVVERQLSDLRAEIMADPAPRRVVLGKGFDLCPNLFEVGSGGSYTAAIIRRDLAAYDNNSRLFSMVGGEGHAAGAYVLCVDLETDARNLTTPEFMRLKASIERGDDANTAQIIEDITRKMMEGSYG
jgi:HEAT repeat protein